MDQSNPSTFRTGGNRNALGGIRTAQLEAPVAKLSGAGQPGASPPSQPGSGTSAVPPGVLCGIFGATVPFSSARLASLYPSHTAFVRKWDAAAAAAVKAGYLLPADARTIDRVVAGSSVGG